MNMKKSIEEMKQIMGHKYACAQDIIEEVEKSGLAMTAEQKKSIDDNEAEGDSWKAKIDALEAQEEVANRIKQKSLGLKNVEKRSAPAMEVNHEPKASLVAKDENDVYCRSGALKAFTNDAKGEKEAFISGQFIRSMCCKDDNVRAKASRWLKENGHVSKAALGTTSEAVGGALIPTVLENTILVYREKNGVARRNSRTIPMESEVFKITKLLASSSVVYTAENNTMTQSDPTFKLLTLNAKNMGYFTLVSNQISDSAVISVADIIAQDAGRQFALKEDTDIFNGDGSSTYGSINGLTHYLVDTDHDASIKVAAASNTTFATTTLADLQATMALLPTYARQGDCKWYMSQAARDSICLRLGLAAGGNNLYSIQDGLGERFLGYPVVITNVLPTAQTTQAGAAYVLFGDLSQTIVNGEVRGLEMSTTKERYWEYNQTGIKFTQRWNSILTDEGTDSVAGSMVALVGKGS